MDLDKCKTVAIIGDRDSGKTNLAVHLLRSYAGSRKIYTLGYPTLIDNFIPLANKLQLSLVQDGIIFIDELHKFFRLYDKNTSREFIEVVSLAAHNNCTLVFTTQLSQNLTKAMEAFLDGFCITRIQDLTTLKNGSRIKRVVENCADIRKTSWGLFLNKGEYLSNSNYDEVGEGGILQFPFQGIGKDWRRDIAHQNTQQNAHRNAGNLPTETPMEMPTNSQNSEIRLQQSLPDPDLKLQNKHFQGKNEQNYEEID
jgi:hypothetical protein